jgi:hypothetical protein
LTHFSNFYPSFFFQFSARLLIILENKKIIILYFCFRIKQRNLREKRKRQKEPKISGGGVGTEGKRQGNYYGIEGESFKRELFSVVKKLLQNLILLFLYKLLLFFA